MNPLPNEKIHDATASFWERVIAHNIDFTFLLILFYGLNWIIEKDSLLYLSCLIVSLVYDVAFGLSRWRGTPGKRLVGLRIVGQDSSPLSSKKMVFRTLAKLLSALVLFLGFGLANYRSDVRSLHDLLVGSKVVKRI